MKNNLFEKVYKNSKIFIENFEMLKDYSEISKHLKKIGENILKTKNIKESIKIEFEDNKAFGNCATEYPDKISFNKLRYDTIISLKLDCTSCNHLEKIYNFYNHYNENDNNTKFEICLYNFMKRYISLGLQDYFLQMGSFKTIKYELLETLFHEIQHAIQLNSNKYSVEDCESTNPKDLILIFTTLFNTIYNKLLENNIQFHYIRENHCFPIEFDARYVALIMTECLRKKYFINDKLFIKSILHNDIIPKNVSFKELSKKIYSDFESLYKIYCLNFGTNYNKMFFIVNQHKNEIISQLIDRYEEMNKIYNNLKIELDKK